MTRGWLALHSHEMGQSRQVALGRRVQSVEGRAALKLGRQEFWGALRGAPVLRGCGLKLGPLFFFFFLLDSVQDARKVPGVAGEDEDLHRARCLMGWEGDLGQDRGQAPCTGR